MSYLLLRSCLPISHPPRTTTTTHNLSIYARYVISAAHKCEFYLGRSELLSGLLWWLIPTKFVMTTNGANIYFAIYYMWFLLVPSCLFRHEITCASQFAVKAIKPCIRIYYRHLNLAAEFGDCWGWFRVFDSFSKSFLCCYIWPQSHNYPLERKTCKIQNILLSYRRLVNSCGLKRPNITHHHHHYLMNDGRWCWRVTRDERLMGSALLSR